VPQRSRSSHAVRRARAKEPDRAAPAHGWMMGDPDGACCWAATYRNPEVVEHLIEQRPFLRVRLPRVFASSIARMSIICDAASRFGALVSPVTDPDSPEMHRRRRRQRYHEAAETHRQIVFVRHRAASEGMVAYRR